MGRRDLVTALGIGALAAGLYTQFSEKPSVGEFIATVGCASLIGLGVKFLEIIDEEKKASYERYFQRLEEQMADSSTVQIRLSQYTPSKFINLN
jgi:hypothetical protein